MSRKKTKKIKNFEHINWFGIWDIENRTYISTDKDKNLWSSKAAAKQAFFYHTSVPFDSVNSEKTLFRIDKFRLAKVNKIEEFYKFRDLERQIGRFYK